MRMNYENETHKKKWVVRKHSFVGDYRVVLAHRNWHIETEGWNWAGFVKEGLETCWQQFGQFLDDS